MLNHDTFTAVLDKGRNAGADFAEVYVERWRRRTMRAINGSVAEANSGIQQGAGVRLFFGHDVVYGYTNDLSDEALGELVTNLAAFKGAEGRPDASGRGGIDLRTVNAGPDIHAPEKAFGTRDKLWRLERLREADAAARIAPEIVQVETSLIEWDQEVTVANSDGVLVDDRRVRSRLVTQAIEFAGDIGIGNVMEKQTRGSGAG